MRPIAEFDVEAARGLRGLLFDVDDTLLTDGELTCEARDALDALSSAGLVLAAVTGRSVARGLCLADELPVIGVVAENGALEVHCTPHGARVVDPLEGQRDSVRERLLAYVARLQREFSDLVPATDADERRSDYTFDIGEHRSVAPERVREIRAWAGRLGLVTTRSSIHLHVTLDPSDKATGVLRFLQKALGEDPTRARFRFAYVGDSLNDAPCFAGFAHSVAVQNYRGGATVDPRYVTLGPKGAGFAEAALTILARRAR
jgi:HAD superfamily hydrolase (TIGR01484 family)